MSVMEKLRALFQSEKIPDETRQVYAKASTPRELIRELEGLRGRNEVELRENEQELIGIEKAILLEETSIRKGGLTATEETIVLRRIERLQKQRENLDRQVSIYNENINLHLNLISKIQEMDAMRSRGVAEDQIDQLVEDVEGHVEEYKRVSIAAESGTTVSSAVDQSAERRRLDEIKSRILGAKQKEPQPPEAEETIEPPKDLE
jgi:hypothetical protein